MPKPRAAGLTDPWKLIGPRPTQNFGTYVTSGRVNAIVIDPRSNDIAYAGAADGGIWKTFDGGATWMPLTDDQPSVATGAIALDPSNPDIVYAGTGEENFSIDSYTGVGILKSLDGGVSWTNIVGPFLRQRFAALAVHPNNGRIILGATTAGLFRSTDAGQTWTSVLSGTAISVFFDPARLDTAFAGIGNIDGDPRNGVYRSTDGGATWNRAGGAAPNLLPSGTSAGRIEVVSAPAGPDTVWAAIANPFKSGAATLNGIYRTADSGQHWTRVDAPDVCTPQCWYDLVLRPNPSNSNVVYLGGVRIARSVTGGSTWQTLPSNGSAGSPHVDHHALAFTLDGTRLYDGNDGGVWSTDTPASSTVTWKNLNASLAITQFYPGLSMHPTDPNVSLGGTQDNGTQLYQGNIRWIQVIGGDGGYTAIDPSVTAVAYGSFIDITLFRTLELDFFDSIDATHGIDQSDRHRFIGTYVMDPSNPQRMYYGTYRLYRSLDGAGLWRPVSGDLTNPISPTTGSSTYTISTIAVAPSDSSVIYTGAASGAVYSSEDGAVTWTDRSNGLPARAATHVSVDPADPGTVYVTFSGYTAAAETFQGHVFKSTNFGASWSDISGNLPNLPVNDVVLDPDVPDMLYVATDLGVMASSDAGASWAPLGTGLPHTAVTSLVLQRSTRTLRAGTHGRSAWDYALPESSFSPVISALNPASKNAGGGDFLLTISGSNFGPGIHVRWNGSERTVTSATSTALTVSISASDIQAVGRAAVTVYNPARGAGLSSPANFVIGPAPAIAPRGVVNAASTAGAAASPGAILSIYGSFFTGAVEQAVAYPLPETLGQVTVTVGGIPSPLYFVSPSQINFQVPYGLGTSAGPFVIVRQGTQASQAMGVSVVAASPGLFSLNQRGDGQGAVLLAGTRAIAAAAGAFADSRPAQAGETIEIYGTGFGSVSPAVSEGDPAPSSPLSRTLLQPVVRIGGQPAQVTFSGLTPGAAGLYQINAVIPPGVSSGTAVPVSVTAAGVTSNTVTIAVQ